MYITRIKGLFQGTDWLSSLICRKRSRRANTYSWCAFASVANLIFEAVFIQRKKQNEEILILKNNSWELSEFSSS